MDHDRYVIQNPFNDPIPEIPDFELIRAIGRGGFGQVWLARNRATGLLRAVKLIARSSPGTADPAGREVVSITRLESVRHRQHPNFLDIQHVGQTGDYVFFVTDLADNATGEPPTDAAEYVPATLERRLRAGPLSPAECLDWTRQLLHGLASLHEAGMVHRDVKPANCLFVGGQLKLADFGLLTEADPHTSRIGTQAYMPPDGRMDTRADVYAAGLVVYEILTGYPVERFPQLGERADEVASVPALSRLLRLVLDACQALPERRFADASAMLAALDEAPIAGATPTRLLLRAAIPLAAVLLAAVLIWGISHSRTTSRPPRPPVVPRVHVNFVTEPFGATVLLDGEVVMDDRGQPATTPCTIEDLPARSHAVVFRHADLPDLEKTIDFAQQRQVVESWPALDHGPPLILDSPDLPRSEDDPRQD